MSVPAHDMPPTPGLAALLDGYVAVPPALDRAVAAVCDDSREVVPGAVFFARRGRRVDGRRFVEEAIAAGAAAAVVEGGPAPARLEGGAVVVEAADLAGALGYAASRFYGDPSRELFVAAVTGTNGKTSVTHFTARACGDRCALMGTLGVGRPGMLDAVRLTTPGAVEIHRRLADLRNAGFDMLAMEASSQALDQRRLEAVRIDTAVFTNLGHDHLDYHPGMDAYARAKGSLFETPGLACAVVNADDPFGVHLLGSLPAGVEPFVLTLGGGAPTGAAPVVRGRITGEGHGLTLEIVSPWGSGVLSTRLIGRPNGYNLLAATAVACLHGHPLDAVLDRLDGVGPIPGRMQPLGGGPRPLVVIDYSHTPDALHNALVALRTLCEGALWCVFGCGGERDRGKRPQMASAVQEGADRIIVTDDNPRGECGDTIVADVLAGFADPAAVHVERDRERAIRRAVARARAADVVLIAGKGHETWQERDGVRRPFSDLAVARHALEAWR